MKLTRKQRAPVNQGRQETQCAVCKHARRHEIEELALPLARKVLGRRSQ